MILIFFFQNYPPTSPTTPKSAVTLPASSSMAAQLSPNGDLSPLSLLSISLSSSLFPSLSRHHHCHYCQHHHQCMADCRSQSPPVRNLPSSFFSFPLVRGGSSHGSLAVVAVVMWTEKERERKEKERG